MKEKILAALARFATRFKKVKSPYERIGGESGLRQLVTEFYRVMDTAPEAKRCRDLHHESLSEASEKLFLFLSGWLGGPNLYIEKYGHPRMRKRHFPFVITVIHRDEWLWCMKQSLDVHPANKKFKAELFDSFKAFAEHMRNA